MLRLWGSLKMGEDLGDERELSLGGKAVGPGCPCYVIAEVGMAHDGSLALAHAYVDAVASTGADAVKFQTHIAEYESTRGEPFRVPGNVQDSSRYEYWQRTGFTGDQWAQLADHARERGLDFMSSPFSSEAIDLLRSVGVSAWKIASGEVATIPLIAHACKDGLPVIISSGMSAAEEIDRACEVVRDMGSPLAVMQCTSMYPTPPESLGLEQIPLLRARHGCPVGLSDHSGTVAAGLAAVAAHCAALLEVHIVLDRTMPGPDVSASLTVSELTDLVRGLEFVHRAVAGAHDRGDVVQSLGNMRELFRKSLAAATDLPTGHVMTEGDLVLRKPGTGIEPGGMAQVLGKRLAREVHAGEILCPHHLVEP